MITFWIDEKSQVWIKIARGFAYGAEVFEERPRLISGLSSKASDRDVDVVCARKS